MTNNENGDENGGQGPSRFNFRNNRVALIVLGSIVGLFLFLMVAGSGSSAREIPYSEFLGLLEDGRVESVQILQQHRIEGILRGDGPGEGTFQTNIPYFDDALVAKLREHGVQFSGSPQVTSPVRVFLELLPWVILFFFIWFMFRQIQGSGNRAFSFGKSRAKRFEQESSAKVTFADVAGQTEAKYELQEVVEFLKSPTKFAKIGAKIPTGVLLVGMPGTGKTLLAKACAGEAGVSFFHMSGSDFVEMFVGVGASRVRDLFEQGRKNAPCILFIDELDAVGRTRGAGYGGGHDEREQTLNQMLVEMDGFDTKDGVIILAATNRPDVLDPALLRPGRFDRQIVVDMPDLEEREAILRIHGARIRLHESVDVRRLARATAGSSGADLANLVNEAALYAARKNKETVDMEGFEEARDKLLMGVARKSKVLSKSEKTKTAYHEGGHALLHYYLDNADPLHKVTIVPRGRALGVAMSLPEKDSYTKGTGWLLDRITICYGGYVAEKLRYGETTTGTQNDLAQATELARKMVKDWGMSELGPVAFGSDDEPMFIGKELSHHKEFSESTSRRIDQEVDRILQNCLNRATALLEDHREELVQLASALVEKETLTDDEVRELLGFEERMSEGEDADPAASS
jgi:cell division protease FtsH